MLPFSQLIMIYNDGGNKPMSVPIYGSNSWNSLIEKVVKAAEEASELEALALALPTAVQGDVAAMTLVASGSGEAYEGVSTVATLPAIGDTTSADQSTAIKQSLLALQEDVSALQTTVNGLLAKLRTAKIVGE